MQLDGLSPSAPEGLAERIKLCWKAALIRHSQGHSKSNIRTDTSREQLITCQVIVFVRNAARELLGLLDWLSDSLQREGGLGGGALDERSF